VPRLAALGDLPRSAVAMCVCVCVCKRERERERERDSYVVVNRFSASAAPSLRRAIATAAAAAFQTVYNVRQFRRPLHVYRSSIRNGAVRTVQSVSPRRK